MTGVRRKARRLALQALYEIDAVGHEATRVLDSLLADGELPQENSAFIRELVCGVLENKEKVDLNIKNFAPACI